MNPLLSFSQGPVRTLQTMLRTISHVDHSIPFLRPTGEFDEATLEAVMRFQKCRGLPVTGVVDRQTWDAVMNAFLRAWGTLSPPATLSLFTPTTPDVHPGQTSPLLPLVQEIFQNLSRKLADVTAAPSTGVLDEETAANLRWLQARANLPATGVLDKNTWTMLVRLFDTFAAVSPPRVRDAGGAG